MAGRAYSVEVQDDFLQKITRARPVQALSELIWNSLDADATTVNVTKVLNELTGLSEIVVTDNGTGIRHTDAPELFRRLGGSWKRPGGRTKDGRFLHGQEGRGRFKAFALGALAEWDVTYSDTTGPSRYTIQMVAGRIKEVTISDQIANPQATTGVKLRISEPHRDSPFIFTLPAIQELTETFALYLLNYRNVVITIDGVKLDPNSLIASREKLTLPDITDEDFQRHWVTLEIIEWHSATNRALYLCNEQGFPLTQTDRRFHVGQFQFSAYLSSPYVPILQCEGLLEVAEMRPEVSAILDTAYGSIKNYFRSRAAGEARSLVNEWKQENVYPYTGDAESQVEKVERQVFDIVAVNVAQYMPEFSSAPAKNKAMHLRLLRQAIEKSPEDLQLILGEVLSLPKRKQEELAGLLRDVSLSSIISAAKIVADRLRFITGIERLLFDTESKRRLKERSQLHRIIAQNCWLFGEQFNISVDDQSLTEVLRKHRKTLNDHTAIDEPVKHVSKERGIVDLVLSRAVHNHSADDLTHLVVELKAPKVKIGSKEIVQIEEYASSIIRDERFRLGNPSWVFWVISDDYDTYAEDRFVDRTGKIKASDKLSISVRTWGQIIDENRARMQFFQQRLEYEADKGKSLELLQERYAEFLNGVFVEEEVGEASENPAVDTTEAEGDLLDL